MVSPSFDQVSLFCHVPFRLISSLFVVYTTSLTNASENFFQISPSWFSWVQCRFPQDQVCLKTWNTESFFSSRWEQCLKKSISSFLKGPFHVAAHVQAMTQANSLLLFIDQLLEAICQYAIPARNLPVSQNFRVSWSIDSSDSFNRLSLQFQSSC